MIINQTGGGTQPTGTTQITSNGTHNVAGYEFADVQVPTTAPAHYVEKANDGTGKLVSGGSSVIDLTGITEVGDYALSGAYYNNTSITGNLDLSSLTHISDVYAIYRAFDGCTGITSVDLSGLTDITNNCACTYMFFNCTGITSVDLSSLTTINANGSNSENAACGYMFYGCTGITSVDLSNLITIQGGYCCDSMFRECKNISSVNLRNLKEIKGTYSCEYMFGGCMSLVHLDYPSLSLVNNTRIFRNLCASCTSLQTVSFYALDTTSFGAATNQFNSMLSGCSNVTVHFPMRIQSTIGSWSDVTNGFGGTNTTVLFDIVCTLTGADSNTYTRQQKDSTSTATAWDLGGVLYYTSGTAEPQVNDTVYSDAACTQSVTTVSAIA